MNQKKSKVTLTREYYQLLTPENIVEKLTLTKQIDPLTKMVLIRVCDYYQDIVAYFFRQYGGRGTIGNFVSFINDNAIFFAKNAANDATVQEYFKYNLSYINELLGLEDKKSIGIVNIGSSMELKVRENDDITLTKNIIFTSFKNTYVNIIECNNKKRDYLFLTNKNCNIHYISNKKETIIFNNIEYENQEKHLTFICSYDNILVGNLYLVKLI